MQLKATFIKSAVQMQSKALHRPQRTMPSSASHKLSSSRKGPVSCVSPAPAQCLAYSTSEFFCVSNEHILSCSPGPDHAWHPRTQKTPAIRSSGAAETGKRFGIGLCGTKSNLLVLLTCCRFKNSLMMTIEYISILKKGGEKLRKH